MLAFQDEGQLLWELRWWHAISDLGNSKLCVVVRRREAAWQAVHALMWPGVAAPGCRVGGHAALGQPDAR